MTGRRVSSAIFVASRQRRWSKRLRNFEAVVEMLANDKPLPPRYVDHALKGEWIDHRDCHVAPDLVLIYRKRDNLLELVRLGSHSDLSLD